jgi:DNA-binding MarR family transcriptional regulator
MAERLSVTGEERVLLYLLNFGSLEDVYECDSGLTQKGIAVNVRIQRKHISRHLDKLVEQSLIEEYNRHVKGSRQKMKCYGLTPQGLSRARKLVDSVGKITMKVRINGKTVDMKLADIDDATSAHLRFSDIVCEALESGEVLEMARLESIEEENRRLMDEKTMKNDVYRRALAAAWRSGILTSSEKHLVDALKTHLGISEEDHRAMETVAMNCIPEPYEVRVDLHDEILNLLAGQPPELVEEILEFVRGRVSRK